MHAAPTADEVREQLGRLTDSAGFSQSERLKRFLGYVVDRTLAGEGDRLKEYLIGVDVFDRDESYDPRVDSIVRVEAGRLRSKLDEYYSGVGAGDAVIVRIPRGSYVPVFERRGGETTPRAAAPAAASPRTRSSVRGPRLVVLSAAAAILLMAIAAWRSGIWNGARPAPQPSVAVLPFTHFSTDPADQLLAAQITDGVMSELVRTGTVSVVSRTSVQQFAGTKQPLRSVASALGADILIESSIVRTGTSVRVDVRLVDGRTDRKVWADDFDADTSDVRGLERRIARAAVAVIAEHTKSRFGGR